MFILICYEIYGINPYSSQHKNCSINRYWLSHRFWFVKVLVLVFFFKCSGEIQCLLHSENTTFACKTPSIINLSLFSATSFNRSLSKKCDQKVEQPGPWPTTWISGAKGIPSYRGGTPLSNSWPIAMDLLSVEFVPKLPTKPTWARKHRVVWRRFDHGCWTWICVKWLMANDNEGSPLFLMPCLHWLSGALGISTDTNRFQSCWAQASAYAAFFLHQNSGLVWCGIPWWQNRFLSMQVIGIVMHSQG